MKILNKTPTKNAAIATNLVPKVVLSGVNHEAKAKISLSKPMDPSLIMENVRELRKQKILVNETTIVPSMELYLISRERPNKRIPLEWNFRTNMTSATMEVEVKFTKPEEISLSVKRDVLLVKISNHFAFMSEDGMIPYS